MVAFGLLYAPTQREVFTYGQVIEMIRTLLLTPCRKLASKSVCTLPFRLRWIV
jgi:hypothetical protein